MKYLTFFNNTAHVYVIESENFIKPESEGLENIIAVLSEEEKDRFYRFKNEKAQFTFLTARVYLRLLLSEKITGNMNYIPKSPQCFAFQPPQSLRDSSPTIRWGASSPRNGRKLNLKIETTSTGKPYLKDYPNLFFNLSHTDNLILIAIANSPVGVDVEKNERNADKEAIIKHFFSNKEQQSFFSQPEELRQLAFVKGWTRKEAILKATGEGLSAMKNYEVSFEPETDNQLINTMSDNKFLVKDFIPSDGYAACIAVLNN